MGWRQGWGCWQVAPRCTLGALAAFLVPPDGVLGGSVLGGSGGCCPASPLHPKPASGSGSPLAFPWPLLLASTTLLPRALAAALMCDFGGGLCVVFFFFLTECPFFSLPPLNGQGEVMRRRRELQQSSAMKPATLLIQ